MKSEEPPADNSGPVRTLTAKTFDEEVFKSGRDTFIKFYAPWWWAQLAAGGRGAVQGWLPVGGVLCTAGCWWKGWGARQVACCCVLVRVTCVARGFPRQHNAVLQTFREHSAPPASVWSLPICLKCMLAQPSAQRSLQEHAAGLGGSGQGASGATERGWPTACRWADLAARLCCCGGGRPTVLPPRLTLLLLPFLLLPCWLLPCRCPANQAFAFCS